MQTTLHQAGHRAVVQRPKDQVETAAIYQVRDHPVQDRGPGRPAKRRQQCQRKMRKPTSDMVHRLQGCRVRPVQVLKNEQYRTCQAQPLRQRHHRLNQPEPHFSEAWYVRPRLACQQPRDSRPFRVIGRAVDLQRLGERGERPVAFHLAGAPSQYLATAR
jgi:hypothetical protein